MKRYEDVFQWQRFKVLCRIEFSRPGWWILPLLLGLYIIMSFAHHSPLEVSRNWHYWQVDPEMFKDKWLHFFLHLLTIISFARFMMPMSNYSGRGNYLSLPVSALERYLSRFVVSVCYPLIGYLLTFFYVPVGWPILFSASLALLFSVFISRYTFLKWVIFVILLYYIDTLIFGVYLVKVFGIVYVSTSMFVDHLMDPQRAPWIFSTAFIPWFLATFTLINVAISYIRVTELDEDMRG